MNWLISANSSLYDHERSFDDHGFIDWHQNKYKYTVGDVIYIYCTKPIQKIRYNCEIQQANLEANQIRDDKDYWIDASKYTKSIHGKFMRLNLLKQWYTPGRS